MSNSISLYIKKNKNIVTNLLLNMTVLCINIGFGKFHFLTNDDRRLLDIASGAYGTDTNQYLIFYNIVYGYLLNGLFALTRSINWYVLIPVCLSFISFCVLSYCLFELFPYRLAITWISVVIPTLSIFHYLHFQWTHNAFLFCAVGLLAIYVAGTWEISHPRVMAALGTILLLLGFMTRTNCFFATFPFLLVLIIYDFIAKYKENNFIQRFKLNKKLLIYLGISLLLCFFVKVVDIVVYNFADAGGWEYHREYNVYRSNLWDYGGMHFDDNQEEYNAIGIEAEAAQLFDEGIWADQNQFDLDTLKKANDIRKHISRDVQMSEFSYNIYRTIMTIRQRQTFPLMALIVVAFLYSLWQNRKRYLELIPLAAGFIAENLYLCYRGRVEARVIYGLLLVTFIFLIATLKKQKKDIKRISSIGVSMIICLFGWMLMLYENISYQSNVISPEQEVMCFLTDASADQEHLYLLDVSLQQRINQETPAIQILPEDFYGNLYFLGDWDVFTPRTEKILERYGIDNAFEAIGVVENVLLIDTEDGMNDKCEYIEKQYNKEIEAPMINSLNTEYKLFSFDVITVH